MIKDSDREIYKGFKLKQYKGILKEFINIFDNNNFDVVIEIGTCPGGLSVFLTDMKQQYNFDFYTFDIRQPNKNVLNYLETNKSIFHNMDALKNNIIKELLISKKRILILNDGIKVSFFKEYISLLKKDDVMMIHDFNTEWGFDDLKPEILDNNLEYDENLKSYLWFIINRK